MHQISKLYKLLFIFFLFSLNSISLFSQKKSVFNRIHGEKFKIGIFLKWDPSDKKLKYCIDNDNSDIDWTEVDEELIYQIKNNKGNKFKVFIQFYNPLNFSIVSNDTIIDDPLLLELQDFLRQLPSGNQLIDNSIMKNEIISTFENLIPKMSTYSMLINNKGEMVFYNSFLLYQWNYELINSLDIKVVSSKPDPTKEKSEAIININKLLNVTDNYLFGKVKFPENLSGDEKSIKECFESSFELIKKSNDYNSFNKELMKAKQNLVFLKDIHEKSSTSYDEVFRMMTQDYDLKIDKFILKNKRSSFKIYTKAVLREINEKYEKQMEENEKILQLFDKMIMELEEHYKKFNVISNKEHYRKDHSNGIPWDSKEMVNVNYKIKDNEGEMLSSKSFTIAKKLKVYPFISSGLLYSDLSFSNYAVETKNEKNVVSETKESEVGVKPAAFANFIFGDLEPLYPYFQIGYSASEGRSLVPVGLGISIQRSFLVSGGMILGFNDKLNSLNIGEEVYDQKTLENDLVSEGFVSWYFSLTFNMGKK